MNNLEIFQAINNLGGQNIILDNFFIFITLFGNLLLFAVILFVKNKKLILKSLIGYVAVRLVDLAINLIYYRPRPFVVQDVNLLIAQKATASFPSGHAMAAFLFAQLLFFWNRKYGVFAYVLAFLVAFSRVFVGVHYPLDAVVGIALGIGIAFIVKYGFEKHNLMKRLIKHWRFLR